MCDGFIGWKFKLCLLFMSHEVTFIVFQEVTVLQEVQVPMGS